MATDYQARDKAHRERKAMLQDIAPVVARLLGEGWSVHPSKEPVVHGEGDFLPQYVDLDGPDGASISISAGYSYDKTGSITGQLNDRANGYQFWSLPYGKSRPSINVNIARGAKAVAAEIQRRILPDYLPLLAACNEARAAHEKELASAEATAAMLAGVIEGKAFHRDNGTRYDVNVYHSKRLRGASFDVKVSGEYNTSNYTRVPSVQFDRLTVSPKCAAEILNVIARNHKIEE